MPPQCHGFDTATGTATNPITVAFNDFQPVELGVRLTANAATRICAVVIYKAQGVEGRIDVRLWSDTGTLRSSGSGTATAPAACLVEVRTAWSAAARKPLASMYPSLAHRPLAPYESYGPYGRIARPMKGPGREA